MFFRCNLFIDSLDNAGIEMGGFCQFNEVIFEMLQVTNRIEFFIQFNAIEAQIITVHVLFVDSQVSCLELFNEK